MKGVILFPPNSQNTSDNHLSWQFWASGENLIGIQRQGLLCTVKKWWHSLLFFFKSNVYVASSILTYTISQSPKLWDKTGISSTQFCKWRKRNKGSISSSYHIVTSTSWNPKPALQTPSFRAEYFASNIYITPATLISWNVSVMYHCYAGAPKVEIHYKNLKTLFPTFLHFKGKTNTSNNF